MNKVPQCLLHLRRLHNSRKLHESMTSTQGYRERAVVSSFICTSPKSPNGLAFALFKRSQEVNTYQGKWAVCSGSIDATDKSPEIAAKREISEETTLSDSDIFLLRKGKPFSLTDDNLKTRWTIYPFAFQLKENAKPIQFDWEHTEYKFVKPEDLATFDHVPQLEVGMNRVLFSAETESCLRTLSLYGSNIEGCTFKALELLNDSIHSGDLSKLCTSKDFWRELRWKLWHFVENGEPEVRNDMRGAMSNVLDSMITGLGHPEEVESLPLEKTKVAATQAIQNLPHHRVADIIATPIKRNEELWTKIMSDL